jgi:hypothetical protein
MAFTPVLKIGRHYKDPAHLGMQVDLTGEEMLRQAKVAPGEISRLLLNPLSEETRYIEDPLVGQIAFRPRELAPEYSFRWIDTATSGAMAWLQPPQPEELAQRAASRERVTAQLQQLATKAEVTLVQIKAMHEQNRTADASTRKAAFDALLTKLKTIERNAVMGNLILFDELTEKGTGFLQTVADLFGSGATGVRWNFAVPNVEKILLSSWELQEDQTQCFRVLRQSPLPWQVKSEWGVYLGNGWTQYAVVFTKDEAVEFRHYRNMKPRKRRQLELRLKRVLESGYLTASDMAQIAKWQTQIALIRKAASDSGNNKPGSAAEKQIAQIQAQIQKLQKRKNGLTDAMERERNHLERQLYYNKVPVSLQEDARSLFDREFTISIGFSRKGFVWVRIGTGAKPGSSEFRYEVEGITKTGKPGRILPKGSHIMIRSNGGPFGLVYGVADHAPLARLVSQPIEIHGAYNAADWKVVLDAIGLNDADADADINQPLLQLPRARINWSIQEVQPSREVAGITHNAKIRIVLDFVSEPHPESEGFDPYTGNRDYGAQLYRATLIGNAAAPDGPAEAEWDSREHGYPIEDVQLQSDAERGAMHDVFLIDTPGRDIQLPYDLEGRYCDFGFVDTREDSPTFRQYIPVVRGGSTAQPAGQDVRYFARDGKMDIATRLSSARHLQVHGALKRLSRPIEVPLIGNGRRPNEYFRDLMLTNGVPTELITGVPMGELPGLDRFGPVRPGEYPDIKPNVGDDLLNTMRDLTQKHCPGWRIDEDAASGIVFTPDIFRDCTSVNYSTNVVFDHPLAVHRDDGDEFRIWQDVSEYFTDAVITGAYDPGSGRRFASTHRIWEATEKPGSAYFVGERRLYRPAPDDSMRSRAKCVRFGRTFMMRKGLPPWFVRFKTWYDPARRENDLIRLDGIRIVILNLQYLRFQKSINQRMVVTARLAQDIVIPGHEIV